MPAMSAVPAIVDAKEFVGGSISTVPVALIENMLKEGVPGDRILSTYQYLLLLLEPPP